MILITRTPKQGPQNSLKPPSGAGAVKAIEEPLVPSALGESDLLQILGSSMAHESHGQNSVGHQGSFDHGSSELDFYISYPGRRKARDLGTSPRAPTVPAW